MKHLLIVVLILCASIALAQPVFSVGDNVKVVPGITCVNVRLVPAASTPIDCKVPGTAGVIRGGPTMWGSQPYYDVLYSDGIRGWSAAIYLQFVSPGPAPFPPPSGTLTVTRLPGPVTLSFTSENDTALVLTGLPKGLSSGTVTFSLMVDGTFGMTLYGRGGSTTYSVSTVNGVPPPPPPDMKRLLDSAYNAGTLNGIAIGKVLVGVDSVDVWLSNGRRYTR